MSDAIDSPATQPLTDALIKKGLEAGVFVKIGRDDLKPEAQAHYDEIASQHKGFFDRLLNRKPEMILIKELKTGYPLGQATTREGTRVILADEGSHHFTPEYVHKHLMLSNKQLDDAIAKGALVDARNAGLDADTYAKFAQDAGKMGITSPAIMYVDRQPESLMAKEASPSYNTVQTQEGRPFIVINQAALATLTSEQFLGMVGGHENEHIARGDITPEGKAAILNNPQLQTATEVRADVLGGLVTCSPRAMAEALAIGQDIDRVPYMKDHPHASDDDYKNFMFEYDRDHHPRTDERIAELLTIDRHLVKKPDGTCTVDDYNALVTPIVNAAITSGEPSRKR